MAAVTREYSKAVISGRPTTTAAATSGSEARKSCVGKGKIIGFTEIPNNKRKSAKKNA